MYDIFLNVLCWGKNSINPKFNSIRIVKGLKSIYFINNSKVQSFMRVLHPSYHPAYVKNNNLLLLICDFQLDI